MKSFFSFVVISMICLEASAGSSPIVRASKKIPNEYIVVLNEGVSKEAVLGAARELTRIHGGLVRTTYQNLIRGFWVEMNEAQATAMADSPLVDFIEENAELSLAASQQPLGASSCGISGCDYPFDVASLWYLDRIDQKVPTNYRLDNKFDYCSTGAGVRAYVVDNGVHPTHTEFNNQPNRVDTAPALVTHLNDSGQGLGGECHNVHTATSSHGTAVASLIGGKTFGVAKEVTLVDARAFNCGGGSNTTRILKVLEWIPTDPNRGSAASVVNLSFSSSTYIQGQSAIKIAVNTLVDTHNIKVFAAAGNEASDTWWFTPANSGRAIVAGASTISDQHWAFSNYRVDLYAGGQYVESAFTQQFWVDGAYVFGKRSQAPQCDVLVWNPTTQQYEENYDDTCTSGTSFSTPLVAGAAARYLQGNPTHSRDQVLTYLQNESAASTNTIVMGPYGFSAPLLNISDCP